MEFKWPGMMQQLARVVGPRTAFWKVQKYLAINLPGLTETIFLFAPKPFFCGLQRRRNVRNKIPATSLVTQIDSAGQASQRHGLVARSAESGPIKIYVAAAAGVSHKPISWPAGIAMPTAGF